MSELPERPQDYAREACETKLLQKLKIKCKECDARMSTGLQEGNRYYYCGNNTKHEDNLDRYVWVKMPEYLDLENLQVSVKDKLEHDEGEFDTEPFN